LRHKRAYRGFFGGFAAAVRIGQRLALDCEPSRLLQQQFAHHQRLCCRLP
jgi:hypothetical protein